MPNQLVQPYLFFGGRCEEALDFYRQALGAEVEFMMRFKESPEPVPPGSIPDDFSDKIMHVSFRVGQSTIMASDGNCKQETNFSGFSLSISAEDEADAERLFHALAEGGKVEMPLTTTFWAKRFGMVADKFGVGWMISVQAMTK